MNKANATGRYYLALTLVWLVSLLPAMFYGYKQIREDSIVDLYLLDNELNGLPLNRQTAIRISDQVRNDFNVNEDTFTTLDLTNRPFLREDVGFLLTYREGVCGEGTRVIINLLSRLGFDSTRITLFDKVLQSSHTLVSVKIDGREFFLDSINSTPYVNDLLRYNDISSSDFDVLHYSDDISIRREFDEFRQANSKPKEFETFFDNYWLYSYESTPYSKLLTKMGFDARIFNFDRPSRWTSILAERPNMILLIVSSIGSVIAMSLLLGLGVLKKLFLEDLVNNVQSAGSAD